MSMGHQLYPEEFFPDTLTGVWEAVQPRLGCALGILAAVFVSVPFEFRKQRKETVLNHFQLTSLDAVLSPFEKVLHPVFKGRKGVTAPQSVFSSHLLNCEKSSQPKIEK